MKRRTQSVQEGVEDDYMSMLDQMTDIEQEGGQHEEKNSIRGRLHHAQYYSYSLGYMVDVMSFKDCFILVNTILDRLLGQQSTTVEIAIAT